MEGRQTGQVANPPSRAANQACQRFGRSQVASDAALVGAFETTGPALLAWAEHRFDGLGTPDLPAPAGVISNFIREHAEDEQLFVCYFDGPLATPGPPGRPQHNRARILLSVDGDAALDAAGYHDTPGCRTMPIEPIPQQ